MAVFEDCLLETRVRTRRGLATTISFALQLILLGVLVLMPLLFTEALPSRELVTFLVAPAPPPPPPPPPVATAKVVRTHIVHSEILASGELRAPLKIPTKIKMIKEQAPPPVPSIAGVVGGVPGGVPGGQVSGVIGGILSQTAKLAHLPKPPARKVLPPKRVRVSQGVTRGMLIHQVTPRYPALARQARIQGAVQLKAVIAKDGTIQQLQLISGPPLLAPAAITAVKDWRYRPYLLNGRPVEVETQITIKFTLG